MIALAEMLDQKTREKLQAIANREWCNLYAIQDRRGTLCVLVVAECPEEGLKLIRATGLDWELANTFTRRVARNLYDEPQVLNAVSFVGNDQDKGQHQRLDRGNSNRGLRRRVHATEVRARKDVVRKQKEAGGERQVEGGGGTVPPERSPA